MDISEAKQVVETAKDKMAKSISFLEGELATYRIGKANPAVLNSVSVDYYGTPSPIANVASISVPDAKTIVIQPWEKKMISVIEKAIMAANIGFNPQNNGEVIRILVPPLTEERRKDLVKRAKAECENTKVNLRNIRRDGVDNLKKKQKDGLPEDVCKDSEGLLQKELDAACKRVDSVLALKEKEIMTV